jgi:GPI mannosyltransferase 3
VIRPLPRSRRSWLWLGACAAIFGPRAYLAVADQGMIWADEIFQTLEQGHRLAFGYGLVPWEFKAGARSWLLPGILGGLMKALSLLGIGSGAGLAITMKLAFAALSTIGLLALLRIAHAAAGLAGALLFAFVAVAFPASLLYGSRAMSEVACAPFLAWGTWLLWPWGLGNVGRARWRARRLAATPWWRGAMVLLVAGGSFAFAALLRYQTVLLLPVVLLIVATRRGLRAAIVVAVGAVVVVGLGGLLDFATWGRPFKAFIVYVRFNLLESGANQWGVAKRDFYWRTITTTTGPGFWILAVGLVLGLRRTWPVALLALVFVGAHSSIAHKELRFVYPVLPLFLLCSAVGLARIFDRLPLPRGQQIALTSAAGLVLLVLFTARARGLTFADIRQPMDGTANGGPTSPLVWRAFDERNRLFADAGTRADICGLAAPTMNAYWTGGYTYFHRRLPILWAGGRVDYDAANYVVLGPGHKMDDARYKSVAKRGAYQLYRRDGACAAPLPSSLAYGRLTLSGL